MPTNNRSVHGRSAAQEDALAAFGESLKGRTRPRTQAPGPLPQIGLRLRAALDQMPVEAPEATEEKKEVVHETPLPHSGSSWLRPLALAGVLAAASLACAGGVKNVFQSTQAVLTDSEPVSKYPKVPGPRVPSRRPTESGKNPAIVPEEAPNMPPKQDPTPVPAVPSIPSISEDPEPPIAAISTQLMNKIRQRLDKIEATDGEPHYMRIERIFADGVIDTRDTYIGGSNPVKLAPYAMVQDIASPAQYISFMAYTVETPDEVSELIDSRIIPYQEGMEPLAVTPETMMSQGHGDCDDYSELVRQVLIVLGDRKGIDYNPRVIGQTPLGTTIGHAIATYEQGVQKFYIDQRGPIAYDVIDDSSPLFKSAPLVERWFEILTDNSNRSYRRGLEYPGLVPDETDFFHVTLNDERYSTGFDFKSLAAGWDTYDHTSLCFDPKPDFSCRDEVFLENGLLTQIVYSEGQVELEFYEEGKLSVTQYRSGPYFTVYYQDEKPVRAITFSGQMIDL